MGERVSIEEYKLDSDGNSCTATVVGITAHGGGCGGDGGDVGSQQDGSQG